MTAIVSPVSAVPDVPRLAEGRPVARLTHIPALDGLRGLAVAAVLAYHGSFLSRSWLVGGYLGVDLFFVLSGFLITSLLLAEVASDGRVDLPAFWGRRLRRLLPALLAVLVGVAVYAVVIARPVDLGQIRRDALATLFYVANWSTIAHDSSYWDISLAPSPLQHTWSLAIEEQFYLLWPLAVWALSRRTAARERLRGSTLARRILRLALVGAAVSTGLSVGLSALGATDTRVYEGTDTRAVALLLGVALAAGRFLVQQRPTPETGRRERTWSARLELAGVAAASLLGWAWVALPGTSRLLYQGLLPACSVAAVVVVAAAAHPASPVLGRVLAVAPLRWLGMISYGLYLWHWPLYLVLTPARTGTEGLVLLGVRVSVSLVVAVVSYIVVEQPIRRRRWQIRRPLPSAGIAFTTVAMAVVVATAGAVSPVGDLAKPVPRRSTRHIEGAPRLVFMGDSVAWSLVRPVVQHSAEYGVNPFNAAHIACALLPDGTHVNAKEGELLGPPGCLLKMRREAVSANADVVVMVFGAPPNRPVKIDDARRNACSPEYREVLRRQATTLIRAVTSQGALVELATIAPSSSPFVSPEQPRWVRCANNVLRAIAKKDPAVNMLDLDRYVCPEGRCRERVAAGALRPDGLHFDGPGGESVARWIVEQSLKDLGR